MFCSFSFGHVSLRFSFGQRWFKQLIFNNVIGRPEVVYGINDLLAAASGMPTTVCTTTTVRWTNT